MKRRHMIIGGTVFGICVALFALWTPGDQEPLPAKAVLTPPVQTPPPAAMTAVTLPPPPQLPAPAPSRSVEPLTAEAPARTIKPLATEALKPVPESRAVKPLPVKRPPQPTKIAAKTPARVIEPLIAKQQRQDPKPQITAEPDQPAPPKPRAEKPIEVSPVKASAAGRPLLRLLEHGRGPSLEIAWPGNRLDRDRLHRLFTTCYGMRVAVLDGQGRLFVTDSPRGMPWAINTDRFSGFVRRSSGGGPVQERQTVRRIRDRHDLPGGATVRIFPRHADALLLGGLHRLIGNRYQRAGRIQAAYRLTRNHVGITGIFVDGERIPGSIDFSTAAHRGCVL